MGGLPKTTSEFNTLLRQQCAQDHELLLKPDFFAHLQSRCPRIRRIVTQLKRGHERNELIDFRYDVVLHVGACDVIADGQRRLDWQQDALTVEKLEAELAAGAVTVTNVPNGRIAGLAAVWDAVRDGAETISARDLETYLAASDIPGLDVFRDLAGACHREFEVTDRAGVTLPLEV